MSGKNMSRALDSAASWVRTSSTKATLVTCPTVYDRQYRVRGIADGAVALDRAGCAGMHLLQLANRVYRRQQGYYYIPHIVKKIEGRFARRPLYECHYTKVDAKHFEPIEGMWRGTSDWNPESLV